jgi:diacylglycerol kinase family enzyme
MASNICLVLHRKSANEPAVKEAVQYVRSKGIRLRVRIPWNKKDKPRVVKEALADGAKRIIAGGGDGTIGAVVNALVGKG